MIYNMSDLPADQKYCIHCNGEIPAVTAYCPLCGEKQERDTDQDPSRQSKTDPKLEISVTKSDGTELTWGEVKDTKMAKSSSNVYLLISICGYLGIAAVILIALHGMYRVAVGPDIFFTSIAWMFIAFTITMVIGGINRLFKWASPTYRLVTKVEK